MPTHKAPNQGEISCAGEFASQNVLQHDTFREDARTDDVDTNKPLPTTRPIYTPRRHDNCFFYSSCRICFGGTLQPVSITRKGGRFFWGSHQDSWSTLLAHKVLLL